MLYAAYQAHSVAQELLQSNETGERLSNAYRRAASLYERLLREFPDLSQDQTHRMRMNVAELYLFGLKDYDKAQIHAEFLWRETPAGISKADAGSLMLFLLERRMAAALAPEGSPPAKSFPLQGRVVKEPPGEDAPDPTAAGALKKAAFPPTVHRWVEFAREAKPHLAKGNRPEAEAGVEAYLAEIYLAYGYPLSERFHLVRARDLFEKMGSSADGQRVRRRLQEIDRVLNRDQETDRIQKKMKSFGFD